jgi:hypothetical protein
VPRNKDQKRLVRSRMKRTGESYTAARAQVVSRANPPQPATPAIDFAARAGTSDDTMTAKTGRTWREWVRLLDADGAAALRHREIAALVHEKHGVGDWWSQTVTVGYERIKGLRERGQRRSGEFEANKSKTFGVSVSALFDAWHDAATRRRWLDGVDATVRSARKPKTLRLQWPDGTIVVVGFEAKGTAKSVVAVTHTKLRDKRSLEEAKNAWGDRLEALHRVIAARG